MDIMISSFYSSFSFSEYFPNRLYNILIIDSYNSTAEDYKSFGYVLNSTFKAFNSFSSSFSFIIYIIIYKASLILGYINYFTSSYCINIINVKTE